MKRSFENCLSLSFILLADLAGPARTLSLSEDKTGPSLRLNVRVFNYAQVSPETWNLAQELAARITIELGFVLAQNPPPAGTIEARTNLREERCCREAEKACLADLVAAEELGFQDTRLAQSLSALARVYYDQGRYLEAGPLFRRALSIQDREMGGNHPGVAVTLNNLAELFSAQGRYREAEPLFRRALAIKTKTLGRDHHETALVMNNLAKAYREESRLAEARALFLQALPVLEKSLGTEHPVVAMVLNNLASVYQDQSRNVEAEPLYQRALAIVEKLWGEAISMWLESPTTWRHCM